MKLPALMAITILVMLPAGPALSQAVNSATPPSAEVIAQRRAEEALPRTAIAFDPKEFDKYVGFYQLTPRAVMTVTRDGDHFLARLTASKTSNSSPKVRRSSFLRWSRPN